MSFLASLLVGFSLSALIGILAYQRAALTRGGVLGAVLTGTAIFAFGGLIAGFLLVAFFVSSSLLSQYNARAKESVNEKFQKGARRDLGQALANGGWAAVIAIALGIARLNTFDPRIQTILFAAFIGAVASATADTWATEIGVLSKSLPRMITTGRVVPAGTSGAVTLLGTCTAFIGAAFIGALVNVSTFFALWLNAASGSDLIAVSIPIGIGIVITASVSGLLGSLFDSLLGATVQAIYFSEYDERQTEKKTDSQGNPTRRVRGLAWLGNDAVNFFASVFGSLVAAVLAFLIL